MITLNVLGCILENYYKSFGNEKEDVVFLCLE